MASDTATAVNDTVPSPSPTLHPMAIDIRISDGPCPTTTDTHTPPHPSSAGAQAIFVGRTRAETHPAHGPLTALDYDMHEPLVRSVLTKLATDAIEHHDALHVHITHAKGTVPVGEASICIEVHAAHRNEAFNACRMLIDELKTHAPIFKHERWANAETWATGTPPPGATT